MNNILVKAYLKYHMEHGHTKNCLSGNLNHFNYFKNEIKRP